MIVQSKKMYPLYFFLNLCFLVSHYHVNAFHIDKPMIYINFFDEVLTDNATSKFKDKVLTTASTPSNNSEKERRNNSNFAMDVLKTNDEDEPSPSVYYDALIDMPTPPASLVSESEKDSTTRYSHLAEPEFLEPELTRMFFLKAIANLIEHIMVALFSMEEPKLTYNTTSYNNEFEYDETPSRNIKKRDLPSEESVEHKDDSKTSSFDTSNSTVTSSSISEKKKEQTVSNLTNDLELLINEKPTGNNSESEPNTLSPILVSEHIKSHHASHKEAGNKSHGNKRDNGNLIAGVKGGHEIEFIPEGKSIHQGKFMAHKHIPAKSASIDEEDIKMFHFSDEKSVPKDNRIIKKDTHFLEEVNPEEKHAAKAVPEEENTKSTFVVTAFLVGTTAVVIMLLGAVALATGYIFRKSQASEDQNAADLHSSVA